LGSGLITIRAFLHIVRSGVLWPFALYCAVLGGAALVMG